MPKERKSPQEKKQLEYTRDYFSCGESVHGSRKTWPRKKAFTNREYRRKSDELLSQAKPGISGDDADIVAGEITATHLRKSVSRKRLQKWPPITVGEKVKIKLQKRKETFARRANKRHGYEAAIESALNTLSSLEGAQLMEVLRRITTILQGGSSVERMRQYSTPGPLNRAIFFMECVLRGDARYIQTLRKNPGLRKSYQLWQEKAGSAFAKLYRPQIRKREQKPAIEKKIKAILRQSR
jgi:hypothetical protein